MVSIGDFPLYQDSDSDGGSDRGERAPSDGSGEEERYSAGESVFKCLQVYCTFVKGFVRSTSRRALAQIVFAAAVE